MAQDVGELLLFMARAHEDRKGVGVGVGWWVWFLLLLVLFPLKGLWNHPTKVYLPLV